MEQIQVGGQAAPSRRTAAVRCQDVAVLPRSSSIWSDSRTFSPYLHWVCCNFIENQSNEEHLGAAVASSHVVSITPFGSRWLQWTPPHVISRYVTLALIKTCFVPNLMSCIWPVAATALIISFGTEREGGGGQTEHPLKMTHHGDKAFGPPMSTGPEQDEGNNVTWAVCAGVPGGQRREDRSGFQRRACKHWGLIGKLLCRTPEICCDPTAKASFAELPWKSSIPPPFFSLSLKFSSTIQSITNLIGPQSDPCFPI